MPRPTKATLIIIVATGTITDIQAGADIPAGMLTTEARRTITMVAALPAVARAETGAGVSAAAAEAISPPPFRRSFLQ